MLNDKLASLTRLLEGNRDGFTDTELAQRLDTSPRAARRLIAELITAAALPIICDRDHHGDGKYRIAQGHEYDRVNRENGEDVSRIRSLAQKPHGRRHAFLARYPNGALFLEPVPPLEDVA